MTTPVFDNAHPKIIAITFSVPEFVLTCKNSVYSNCWFITEMQSNLESPYLFLAMPTQKYLLINVNLYQCAKNHTISWIYSADMTNLKILYSDWLRTFLPKSQEQIFSQIWDLRRNTLINVNFHYRTKSVKSNDQIFQ